MTIPQSHLIDFRILDRPDMPVRVVAMGETIVEEGSVAHEMFLVRKGRAEIRVKDQPVEEVGRGGIFGEMALIDHSVRSATVVALEDSEVIPINERLFVILVQDAPNFALAMMRTLVARIRAMNAQI